MKPSYSNSYQVHREYLRNQKEMEDRGAADLDVLINGAYDTNPPRANARRSHVVQRAEARHTDLAISRQARHQPRGQQGELVQSRSSLPSAILARTVSLIEGWETAAPAELITSLLPLSLLYSCSSSSVPTSTSTSTSTSSCPENKRRRAIHPAHLLRFGPKRRL